MVDAFEQKYPDKLFAVNLFPGYATTEQLRGGYTGTLSPDEGINSEYELYVDEYFKNVLSKVKGEKWLSVDTYPIQKVNGVNRIRPGAYITDIAVTQKFAQRYGATLHVVLQGSSWVEGGGANNNRIPSEADYRMQVYTALAMGATTYSYFSYPPINVPQSDKDLTYLWNWQESAMVTDTGEKTAAWYAAQKVNSEVHAFDHVLLQFGFKGFLPFLVTTKDALTYEEAASVTEIVLDTDITDNKTDKTKTAEFLDTRYLKSITSNNNLILGLFEDDAANEGYMLANYAETTQNISVNVSLDISDSNKARIYKGGQEITVDIVDGRLDITLLAGEGIFIIPYNSL